VKVWIEVDQCTGAGLCEMIEHRVFALGEDGLSRVKQDGRVLPAGPDNPAEVADCYADRVREASRACPGDCIRFQIDSAPVLESGHDQ
jgi:ferredoxin